MVRGETPKRSWRYMAPVLASAPDDVLQTLAHGVSWWLQAIAKTFEGHEVRFFSALHVVSWRWTTRRASTPTTPSCVPSITRWATSPRHCCAGGIDARWRMDKACPRSSSPRSPSFAMPGSTSFGMAACCWQRMSSRCSASTGIGRRNTCCRFSTGSAPEAEARAAWEGFLWSPRLYRPLMEMLKPAFLDTARHYAALGKHDGQYASLLTFAALDPGDTFTHRRAGRRHPCAASRWPARRGPSAG